MSDAVLEYPSTVAVRKKRRQGTSDPRWLPPSLKMEIERLLIEGLTVRQVILATRTTLGSVARCRKHLIELGVVKAKPNKPHVHQVQPAKVLPIIPHQIRNPHARIVTPPTRQIAGSSFGPIPLTRLMARR